MKNDSPSGFKTKVCAKEWGWSSSVFNCPSTLIRIPPSNMGWQSTFVIIWRIFWKPKLCIQKIKKKIDKSKTMVWENIQILRWFYPWYVGLPGTAFPQMSTRKNQPERSTKKFVCYIYDMNMIPISYIIEVDQVSSKIGIVKCGVVLLGKSLTDGVVLRI